MPSEKFRITTNGQSLRNPNNTFFDMTLSANLTLDESSDMSANNDRRSAHNALERQRREELNSKFQQLAHALPSLQSVRRPSKATIVSKSLDFVSSSLKRESDFKSEIETLRLENEKLKQQAEQASANLKKREAKQDQLSPPPTPKSLDKKRSRSQEEEEKPQKKRMMKQEREKTVFDMTPYLQDNTMNTDLFMSMYDNRLSYNSLINPMLLAHYYSPENLIFAEQINYLS